MPAYSFTKFFAPLVECGFKRHTIRRWRKGKGQQATPGCTLFLYTEQRSKNCRFLGEHECESVLSISINRGFIFIEGNLFKINTPNEKNVFALQDGFRGGAREMFEWFDKIHGLPFEGCLITWKWEQGN